MLQGDGVSKCIPLALRVWDVSDKALLKFSFLKKIVKSSRIDWTPRDLGVTEWNTKYTIFFHYDGCSFMSYFSREGAKVRVWQMFVEFRLTY